MSHQNDVPSLVFLVVGDMEWWLSDQQQASNQIILKHGEYR